MASVQTSSYGGRYLKLTVVEESTSITANTSTVKWTLESIGGGSTYYTIYNCRVDVNGSTVANYGTVSWSSGKFPAKADSVSGTVTVGHKTDGTADPISFTLHGKVYNSGDENLSGSLSLSTIPRYTSITSFSVNKLDETSVSYGFTASNPCDWAMFSTDNGNSWYDLPNSGIIGSLSPNTTYNFKLKVRRTDSKLWTESSTVQQTTYDYPKPTTMNNFTIGEGASITLYNPLGRYCTLEILQKNTNAVLGSYTGTYNGVVNYDFKTADAINKQYASIPNSKFGNYYAKVTYGSSVRTLDWSAQYYINGTETPTFDNFTYADTNSFVTGVTGNNQILVKGLSTPKVTISSANKMVANKSANPSSYTVSIDTLNKSVSYVASDLTIDLASVVPNAGTKRLTVTAYDSRTLSKEVYKDVTVMDYAKPVINATVTRLNNFENQTTLKVAGTYTRLTIDNVDKNTINRVQYRYRETGKSWGNWTQISTNVTNGKYTCNDVILNLDNSKSFEFEILTVDSLSQNTATNIVDIGQAIFMISSNKKKCYINGSQVATLDDITPISTGLNTVTGKVSNIETSISNINSSVTQINLNDVAVTTRTDEVVVGSYTIPSSGHYLITGFCHPNYYGQNGRDILTRLKRNGSPCWTHDAVYNTYVWTCSHSIVWVMWCDAGDKMTFTIQSGTATNWSFGGGHLVFTKLK